MITIADIPVYRRSLEQHADHFKQVEEKELEAAATWGPEATEAIRVRQQSRDPAGWYPWRYNDVVGWVRVYIETGLVHFAVYRRRGRGRADPFVLEDGSAWKIYGSMIRSNQQFRDEAQQALQELRQSHFKKCVVDDAGFIAMLPHVDWLTVISDSTHETNPE